MMIPTYAQVVNPQPEPRPGDLGTPEPQYVEAGPVPDGAKPEPMVSADKQRLRRAAFRATQAYPGAVGKLIARELTSFEEFGYRIGGGSLVWQLVDDVFARAGEHDGERSPVRPFSRR